MADTGHPLDASAGPIITNFPIWMAESQRTSALALPDEPPRDVLDLARTFKATLVVLLDGQSTHWPSDIDDRVDGADCFRELDLGVDMAAVNRDPLGNARAFEVVCP
jgi:NAD-dependent oxidoreductase involved in siderophore biosynthesis